MSTFFAVVVLVALTFGPAECQRCELFCPESEECLNQTTVCNAVNDCENGSGFFYDEDRCTDQGMFNCTNGMAVNIEMLCDENNDCGDNSDEEYELCPTTSVSPNNDDSNEYDLVVPRLVLFAVIPFVIVLILMVIIPVVCVCVWRLCKLRRMKNRLTIAESARTGGDTLEQDRLTRGTFRNTYADTSFSVADQTLPQSQQASPAPPQFQASPAPPRFQTSPAPPQFQAPPRFQTSPAPPQFQAPPRFQTSPAPPQFQASPAPPQFQASPYYPRFPAPLSPASYQQQQPPPPPQPAPPPEAQSNALQSTSEVAVDVVIPSDMPPPHVIGDRTSTISGASNVLASVTAAEAKKRYNTVSGDGPSSMKRNSSSAFRQWERPTTPPPLPPINGAPAIPPKPNSPTRHLMDQQPSATYGGEEDDEPLYEPIPGDLPDQYETMTVQQVTSGGYDDDDTYVIDTIDQSSPTSTQYDTYDVPRSVSNSPSYEVSASNSVPPPRPPKPNKSQNSLDKLVQEDPVNQTADFDREVANLSQVDDTYEVVGLHEND